MEEKNKNNRDAQVRKISAELGELIDMMKEPIVEFSWGAVKVSDYEASKALARKIKDTKILTKAN